MGAHGQAQRSLGPGPSPPGASRPTWPFPSLICPQGQRHLWPDLQHGLLGEGGPPWSLLLAVAIPMCPGLCGSVFALDWLWSLSPLWPLPGSMAVGPGGLSQRDITNCPAVVEIQGSTDTYHSRQPSSAPWALGGAQLTCPPPQFPKGALGL